MNLKDFYYFLDLSQQQSFTGVAQKHGISQPSVSYAIKRLEKEFHCPLIAHDPSHRTFKLTPRTRDQNCARLDPVGARGSRIGS